MVSTDKEFHYRVALKLCCLRNQVQFNADEDLISPPPRSVWSLEDIELEHDKVEDVEEAVSHSERQAIGAEHFSNGFNPIYSVHDLELLLIKR
jgi:hypothetical protein